jgi:biopolymer transport protein ExbD
MNDPILIIQADAGASHQAVMNVLEAAKQAGLGKVTFAAKSGGK